MSCGISESEAVRRVGLEAYSYYYVYQAFAPLFRRWGPTALVTRPESRLDYALWRFRQNNLEPVHLSLLPLHLSYLTARAPNVAFPFWEFPDIPDDDFGHNPRNNWVRIAKRLSLLLAASTFTKAAFERAGVPIPIHVVPVPIPSDYFDVPPWDPGQRAVLDCPCYRLPQPYQAFPSAEPSTEAPRAGGTGVRGWAKQVYKAHVRPLVPRNLDRYLTSLSHSGSPECDAKGGPKVEPALRGLLSDDLALSGVVYTSIFNPFDPRKNWQDLLSAYLLALRDCADATLVVKLVVNGDLEHQALALVLGHYQSLQVSHRCKVAVVTAYLSDEEMVGLARASTYYVTATRAEGSCLPLQNFLAAGRPGIAPGHTALAEYFHSDLGFVVASHPEPTGWPHDPEPRLTTTWHRLVWQSLRDQIRVSYEVATQNRQRYQTLARRGREHMEDFASAQRVWPRLAAALDSLAATNRRRLQAANDQPEPALCQGK